MVNEIYNITHELVLSDPRCEHGPTWPPGGSRAVQILVQYHAPHRSFKTAFFSGTISNR